MTIDEKIAEERELAQREKNRCTSLFGSAEAREHEQLAEWLEELKELREESKR